MMRVRITNDQQEELEQVSRQAVGRVALRAPMVLRAAHGYRVPQIAEVPDCGQDVVRLWLQRYQEEGVRGLEDTPRPGRPRTHALTGHSVETRRRRPASRRSVPALSRPAGRVACSPPPARRAAA